MAQTLETSDAAAPGRQQWCRSPWDRLRFAVAEANLRRNLPEEPETPLRVLDLAGGDGGDALRLAARGHHVTIVDRDSAMLSAACERALAAELTGRISCVRADVHSLPSDLTSGYFDVVLCHNLLPYVEDPSRTLTMSLTPLRPGGLISVMALNRYSVPLRTAIRETDLPGALDALEASSAPTVLDTEAQLYAAEEVCDLLEGLGCTDVRHYGIRCVCDYITDDALKEDSAFYADLERLELALSGVHPYMHTARLFQLIARKPGG